MRKALAAVFMSMVMIAGIGCGDTEESEGIDAPVILSITPDKSSFTVYWSSVDQASNYVIYYSTAAAGVYTEAVRGAWGTSWSVSGLVQDTTYFVKMSSIDNNSNEGGKSAPFETKTLVDPNVPANLTLTSQTCDTIQLSWDPVGGASSYKIYRAKGSDPANFTQITPPFASATSIVDMALVPNSTYVYKVSALVGWEYYSKPFSVTTDNTTPVFAYVRFKNTDNINYAGLKYSGAWKKPVNIGETTPYINAAPGSFYLQAWNTSTLVWDNLSVNLLSTSAGQRYTFEVTPTMINRIVDGAPTYSIATGVQASVTALTEQESQAKIFNLNPADYSAQ